MFKYLSDKFNGVKLECIYSLSMLFIGIMLVFLIPPFQVPDEIAHYVRAYQISEGIFCSPSREYECPSGKQIYFCADIPTSLSPLLGSVNIIVDKNYYSISTTINTFSIPFTRDNYAEIQIANTGGYSPLVYAPQALGIFIARTFADSIGSVYYSARLGSVFFTIICIALSIRLLPEKKLLIFLTAFSPMFLWEAASCSADAVVNSVSILVTAYLLSLRRTRKLVSTSELILIMISAIFLGLAKQVYGTVLLLYCLIPAERFGGNKHFYSFGLVMLSLYIISALGWIHLAKSGANVSPYLYPSEAVNVAGQTAFIIDNPIEYLKVFISTLKIYLTGYLKGFIGVLGWLTVPMPKWFYAFYGIVIIIGGIIGNLNLTPRQRLFMGIGVFPTVFVTFLYMYITWTPLQASVILGIQGRYFIPIAVMLLAVMSCVQNNRYENLFACTAGLTSVMVVVFATVKYFY